MNWSRFPRFSRRQPRSIAPVFFLVVAAAAVLTTGATPPSPGTPQEELGRLLFWDPVLSGPMDVSCATCHHPDFAYADGRALSLGPGAVGLGPDRVDLSGGVIPVAQRNSPTLLNVAYNGLDRQRRRRRGGPRFTPLPADLETVNQERAPMFWDRRARSLETQALLPLAIREEMRGDAYPEEVAVDSVVARLRAIPEYVSLFREVYGEETSIDATQIAGTIAAFERTLIARNSPFDRFLAGDVDALTTQQRRGLDEFNEADCSDCHRGPMLSDFNMHAEGVAENPLLAEPDAGDGPLPLPHPDTPQRRRHRALHAQRHDRDAGGGARGGLGRSTNPTAAPRTPTCPTGAGGAATTTRRRRRSGHARQAIGTVSRRGRHDGAAAGGHHRLPGGPYRSRLRPHDPGAGAERPDARREHLDRGGHESLAAANGASPVSPHPHRPIHQHINSELSPYHQ